MFPLRSGLRFSFRALEVEVEVPEPTVRKRPLSLLYGRQRKRGKLQSMNVLSFIVSDSETLSMWDIHC